MRRWIIVLIAIVVLAAAIALAAGCGGTNVAGTYKPQGADAQFKDVTLVMNDDGTFKLSGPDADTGKTMTITGTYTVDGSDVSLKAKGIDEAEKGTIKDDGTLEFQSVTWAKE